MLRRSILSGAALFTTGVPLLAGAGAYDAEIAEWRRNYDRDLRSEKGPLWLNGRHNIPEGKSEIGSAGSISLPERAPKRVGVLDRRGDKLTFEPVAGIAVTLNGKPMTGPSALRAGTGSSSPGDKLAFGDFQITVSGGDGLYQLIVRDRQSPYVTQFHGAVWFPVNARYCVEGAFTPYPQPKELKVPDTGGRTRTRIAPGYVTFPLGGETRRLEPVAIDGVYFFMFKDGTTGHETYGAGRYLDTEAPKNGKIVLDFNKAYNPYCAFNPYSSCPLPPKYNTLAMRVEAGEKYQGHH